MRKLSQRLGRKLVLGCVATIVAGASQVGAPPSTRTRRGPSTGPGTTTKYRVVGYGDSIFAGYHGSISSVAKRAAPWVDGEYAVEQVERRRRGRSAAPSRAPRRTTSTTTRSSASARTCRPRTRASSPSRCAATTSCRRAATSPARRGTCNYGVIDTRAHQLHELPAARHAGDQPVRHHAARRR